MRTTRLVSTFLTALGVGLMTPSPASACGGLFCDAAAPVLQNRERIVFGLEDGEVEVHVQVTYAGEAERFAWVVPVPGVPDVGLSSARLFSVLPPLTSPAFQLDDVQRGDRCVVPPRPDSRGTSDTDGDSIADIADTGDSGEAGGIDVVASGTAGAYVWTTLTATTEEALRTWLDDNGYDTPPSVGKVLGSYVSSGQHFIAIKLKPGARQGDLLPLRLRYAGDEASIPLVLTGVAAEDDMRLEVYVYGAHRAVPDNYLHVEINEAAIDWERGGVNYADVVRQAADEAGGQAWATDMAGTPPSLERQLHTYSRYDVDDVADAASPADAVGEMVSQYGVLDALLRSILLDHVDPEGVLDAGTRAERLAALLCVGGQGWCSKTQRDLASSVVLDQDALAADYAERVVEPLREAQALVDDKPFLTRMTSSMSADEMTLDPRFVLDASWGPVDRVREATRIRDCRQRVKREHAPRWIELRDGRRIRLPTDAQRVGFVPPTDLATGPQALRMARRATTPGPATVRDQTVSAGDALDAYNDAMAAQYPWGQGRVLDPWPADDAGDPVGCAQAPASAPWWIAAGLALLARRRSRPAG